MPRPALAAPPAVWPGHAVVVEPPVSRNAVPQIPVSLPPTLVGLIVRLNGVSQLPTNTLPKPPLRPSALLRPHQPSWLTPRKSAVLVHWNHADRPPPSFSSPLKPISLPGVWMKSALLRSAPVKGNPASG